MAKTLRKECEIFSWTSFIKRIILKGIIYKFKTLYLPVAKSLKKILSFSEQESSTSSFSAWVGNSCPIPMLGFCLLWAFVRSLSITAFLCQENSTTSGSNTFSLPLFLNDPKAVWSQYSDLGGKNFAFSPME